VGDVQIAKCKTIQDGTCTDCGHSVMLHKFVNWAYSFESEPDSSSTEKSPSSESLGSESDPATAAVASSLALAAASAMRDKKAQALPTLERDRHTLIEKASVLAAFLAHRSITYDRDHLSAYVKFCLAELTRAEPDSPAVRELQYLPMALPYLDQF